MYSFDDLNTENGQSTKSEKPFFMIKDKPEKELIDWLNSESSWLKEKNKERFREIRKFRALYEGIQYRSQGIRSRTSEIADSPLKKVVLNHIFDLVANKVSKVTKYKSGIAVLPQNDEAHDKIAAKSSEALVKHIWNTEDFHGNLTPKVAKTAFVDGEVYLHVCWDPEKGDVHPDQLQAQEMGQKLQYFDEDGKPVKDAAGKPVMIEKSVKTGDVKLELVNTVDLLVNAQPTMKYEDAEFIFRMHVGNIHDLKDEYPKVAGRINAAEDSALYQVDEYEKSRILNPRADIVWYEFWHKKTKKVPKGFHCKFTKSVILEQGDLPYEHGELPFSRYTDIDFLNDIHGTSFLHNLKGPAAVHNNLTNMAVRNQYLCAHPKWAVPAGSVNKEELGNDITIVQYKGPQAPVLMQQNPTPPEVFKFREAIKEEMQQIAGIFGVSRGEPPKGIEAGVALQFLSEQENERFNEIILKWSEWIRQTAILIMKTCKQYYKPDDKRTIAVLGKDNAWSTKLFDPKTLDVDYDVKVQNASALPESKSGRISLLMQLKKDFPDMISDDRFLDLLDFAQDEKFVDLATASIKSAEMENEMLISDDQIHEPEEWEDHISHWEVHLKLLRSFSFKSYGPEVKQKLLDHLMATEFFMVQKAQENPAYFQGLQGLTGFPVVYVPDAPLISPENAMAQEEAAMGGEMLPPIGGDLPVNPVQNQLEEQQLVNQP